MVNDHDLTAHASGGWRQRATARAIAIACVLLPLVPALLFTLAPQVANAQAEEEARLVIIYPVPIGGTKMLAKEIIKLENTRPYPEKWFAKKVKDRGIEPDGILENSKDLRWAMDRIGINLILDFTYDEDTELYTVYFYSATKGEVIKTIDVNSDEDGLTIDGAEAIASAVSELLDGRGEDPDAKGPDKSDPDEKGPDEGGGESAAELRAKAIAEQEKKNSELPSDFLEASIKGRLTKHDLLIGGGNGAVTNYQSAFYPGYELNLEAFPLVFAGSDVTAVGLHGHLNQGFDKVTIQTDGMDQVLQVKQLHAGGGVSYRLDTPRKLDSTEKFIRARLRLGVRYLSTKVDENPAIPNIAMTAVVLSGHVAYPLFGDFTLLGGVEFVPFAAWGDTAAQFGETSTTYGMGSILGGRYMFTQNLGFTFDYNFSLYRTVFEGIGTANFIDANSFDFFQALTAGVHIQY